MPATSNIIRRRALKQEQLERSTLRPEQHAQAPAGGLHCGPYCANPRWTVWRMTDSVLRCYFGLLLTLWVLIITIADALIISEHSPRCPYHLQKVGFLCSTRQSPLNNVCSTIGSAALQMAPKAFTSAVRPRCCFCFDYSFRKDPKVLEQRLG